MRLTRLTGTIVLVEQREGEEERDRKREREKLWPVEAVRNCVLLKIN